MRLSLPSRRTVGAAGIAVLVSALGLTAGVFVAGSAAASSASTTKKSTTSRATTTKKATTTASTGTTAVPSPAGSNPLAAKFFVINGTVHAASDHEILGSSAFPNYSTGAVDNYYSMAQSHVDNSPFAEGTASPLDTGPIGQTAAAGNTQQTQYADARWPGNSGKASFGTKGQPYASAEASEYRAVAESSEASSALSAPGGSSKFALPKGFDGRLREKLDAWKATWDRRLHLAIPAGPVKVPAPKIAPPAVTVPTPVATVTTPTVTVGGLPPAPSVTVPLPSAPPAIAPGTAAPSRSLSSASAAPPPPPDGAALLESSSLSTLDAKTGALVTSGESRVGRVSIGDGQIAIEGIRVTASITNDGTPADKAAVSIASASIGGVPVTIDQDGVHVSGQGAGLPYGQASDALNTALKQAGIQLFLVAPEVKKGSSCDATSSGNGSSSAPTTTTTTTTSPGNGTDTNGTGSCDQSGMSSMSSSCGGTDTSNSTTTTTSSPLPAPSTGTTTTKSSGHTSTTGTTTTTTTTTDTTSSCGSTDTTSTPGSCSTTSTKSGTTSTGRTDTTPTTTGSSDGSGTTGDATGSSEETVTATGLHVVFTQPVGQSGVPAQYAEHILGEVYVDSLATPAGALPNLNLSFSSSSCRHGLHTGGKKPSGLTTKGGGSSTAGGSSSASSPSGSASTASSGSPQPGGGFGTSGGGSQLASGSTGGAPQSFPARLASALRKPLWLLLAYLVWQALVIGTGASLWSWRKDGGA